MKCFYHNDIDGKCAGSIVARKTGNYNREDYIIYDYENAIPTELISDGETVYFVDLSFSKNSVDKLQEIIELKKCNLIWCDHHSSSMDILEKYPEYNAIKGIRKEGISGAALTYMYLYECEFKEIPTFIKLISDFDCWQFRMDNTLEFKYAIESKEYDALDILWNRLMRDSGTITKALLCSMIQEGKIIAKYVEKEYEQYCKNFSYESRIDGYKCLVVNRSCNSLVFGKLIDNYPIVAIWAYNGRNYKYSLYTTKPDVDCSKIAEEFGGGGHKKAAGFVSNKQVFENK